MSKDIPIIFSAPMIRALLNGSKTQTRRILKPQLVCSSHAAWPDNPEPVPSLDADGVHCATCGAGIELDNRRKSGVRGIPVRYSVGDRLWVRENFAYVGTCDPGFLTYGATYPDDLAKYGCENVPGTLKEAGYKWKPSIHMPREVSRLTLLVTGVKVERLNAISESDAMAEGSAPIIDHGVGSTPYLYRIGFEHLWCSIHGATAWIENPFVVAITFRVIKANIDAPEARAA